MKQKKQKRKEVRNIIVSRVEKYRIKQKDKFYPIFCDFTHKAKNLYNHANFIIRKEYIMNQKWIRYHELDKILKKDEVYTDYKDMPTAQSAQQVLRLVDKNWKSFFTAMKDYTKNKEKYLGRPKIPKYKAKNGNYLLILTNQNVKLKENTLYFPKVFDGFTLKPNFIQHSNFHSFQQVRILPNYKSFTIELVYHIDVPNNELSDNGRYLGIDIGIDNFAAIISNVGLNPIILNGKGLKSMNKYYNKRISHYRGIAKRMNGKDYTNRMNTMIKKRNERINDYLHKASRYVIQYSIDNHINIIVIGNNKGWKQNSFMSKKVNQTFVGIPHQRFIEMVQYKAREKGLHVILTEESYTSGTSFLDGEAPTKENYHKVRRIKRGLFQSNNQILINADVNGAYQILRKVFPKVTTYGIEGVVLHPVRVNIA